MTFKSCINLPWESPCITSKGAPYTLEMDCSSCTIPMPGPSLTYCGGTTMFMFMAMLEGILRKHCDIEDPCNHINPVQDPLDEYDFIVVGAGSAGSVVANRLSENPDWKVLVVEAGVNEPTISQVPALFLAAQKTSVDWQYSTEPEKKACLANGGKCSIARGKVIGGTSVLFGMIYERGAKQDYDDWEEAGNYDWNYKDVLRYFKKSEDNKQINEVDEKYHGVGGYLPISYFPWQPAISADILKAAEENGYEVGDINGARRTRFGVFQSTTKNGVHYSAARAFLRPIRNRPNLHIMLNSTVTRVLISKQRANGVEILTGNGRILTVRAKKEVVVSGGTYNSPQILLLSGVGDKNELKEVGVPVTHHLPGVGRNFHTQISLAVKFVFDETAYTNNLNNATAMQYLKSRDGPLSSRFAVTGFLNSKNNDASLDHPDIQLAFRGYTSTCSQTGEIQEVNKNSITISSYVLRPKSRGYVKLRDNNFASKPVIVMNLLDDPYDTEIVIDGIYQSIDLMKAKALEAYNITLDPTPVKGCEQITFNTDDYWRCAISRGGSSAEHPVGTCKMGPASDKSAVVDPELRVHGIKNLRVIDAAIMPNIISGYTYATSVMIGEKGADMIKKHWSKQLPVVKFL